MLTRLTRFLLSVGVLAFLLGGATVAMEALGLIFHDGPVGPGQRAEEAIAKIEASLDPRDLPSEAESEGLWPPPDAQPTESKQAVGDHEGQPPSAVADGSALTVHVVTETEPEAGPESEPEAEPESKPESGPGSGPATRPEVEPDAADSGSPGPKSVALAVTADKAAAPAPKLEPAPGPVHGTKACTEPCNAKPPAQKRAMPSRTLGNVSCPISAWIAGG